ncbi:hypothetical protein ACLE0G_003693 [Cronobacter turicensis]
MTTFVFLKKGSQLFALDKADTEIASGLKAKCYEKQFEEIDAAVAEQALKRYADIKKEEGIPPSHGPAERFFQESCLWCWRLPDFFLAPGISPVERKIWKLF